MSEPTIEEVTRLRWGIAQPMMMPLYADEKQRQSFEHFVEQMCTQQLGATHTRIDDAVQIDYVFARVEHGHPDTIDAQCFDDLRCGLVPCDEVDATIALMRMSMFVVEKGGE